jgi:hypothetical protein
MLAASLPPACRLPASCPHLVLTSAVFLAVDLVALNALAAFLGETPGGGLAGGEIVFGFDLFSVGYE